MHSTEPNENILADGRHLSPDLPAAVVQLAIDAMQSNYGLHWLEDSTRAHPLRTLWGKRDFISTQELFWIGDSIRLISAVDPRWLKDCIEKTKSFERNRAGFMFKLILIAALIRGGQPTDPAPPNAPGIDATCISTDGRKIVLSMKSFGATMHELEFLKQSKWVSNEILAMMTRRHLNWSGFVAIASQYPNSTEWVQLSPHIQQILSRLNKEPYSGIWKIYPENRPGASGMLATGFQSYSHLISSPHHDNEPNTFSGKIREASVDLENYSKRREEDVLAVLFIRLSENADLAYHLANAQSYLRSSSSPIAGIFLIQTAVAVQCEKDTSAIVISACAAWKDSVLPAPLHLVFPSGIFSKMATYYDVFLGREVVRLEPGHVYSESNSFPRTNMDLSSLHAEAITANGAFRPGFNINMVFALDEENEFAFSPRNPIPTRLSLFT